MCLACEDAEMFYRWQMLQAIAKGEMPEGVSEDDLRAMDLPLPSEVDVINEADGSITLRRKEAASMPAPASAFSCDSPE